MFPLPGALGKPHAWDRCARPDWRGSRCRNHSYRTIWRL